MLNISLRPNFVYLMEHFRYAKHDLKQTLACLNKNHAALADDRDDLRNAVPVAIT
jgi:hypothetical protein